MFGQILSLTQGALKDLHDFFESDLKKLPAELKENADYFDHVVMGALKFSHTEVDELVLPDIGRNFTKEAAIPKFMWGLVWDEWERGPNDGTSIFLQDYANRGLDNRKKKAYYSAVTPDLYGPKYQPKIESFLNRFLDSDNAGKPLMSIYQSTGPRFHHSKFAQKYAAQLTKAEDLIERFGGMAVFIGRFVPAIRSIVPAVVGISGFRRRKFFLLDLLACAGWAIALGILVSLIERAV